MEEAHIIRTVTVTYSGPEGVTAIVDGVPTHFRDMRALFSTAVRSLEQIPAASPVRLNSDHEGSRP